MKFSLQGHCNSIEFIGLIIFQWDMKLNQNTMLHLFHLKIFPMVHSINVNILICKQFYDIPSSNKRKIIINRNRN